MAKTFWHKQHTIRFNRLPDAWGNGSGGVYFKLDDKTGVKVPGNGWDGVKDFNKEVRILKKLNKIVPGLFPKFLGVCKVLFPKSCWACQNGNDCPGHPHIEGQGIIMEHINGKRLNQISQSVRYHLEDTIVRKHFARLAYLGVKWSDGHGGNIIQTGKNRVRFIDATPRCFKFTKPKGVLNNAI